MFVTLLESLRTCVGPHYALARVAESRERMQAAHTGTQGVQRDLQGGVGVCDSTSVASKSPSTNQRMVNHNPKGHVQFWHL